MIFEFTIFLTGFLFLLFLILLIILGFIAIYLFFKKILNLQILEYLILSMIIGVSLYLFYAYFIETFVTFNFLTIIFPIVIFDFLGIFYIIKKEKNLTPTLKRDCIKNYLKLNKTKIINFLFFLSFFIIIFIYQYFLQTSILFLNDSFLSKDPFYWCSNQMYLIETGHLNYQEIEAYPSGLLFLNGGPLLFYPNFEFIHNYYKFIPIFYLGLLIFIMFVFSKRFFNYKIVIFFCMFGFLLIRNFNSRFLRPTPSVLGTIFAFMIFIFFLNPKLPKKLIAFVIAGTFLFHPLYGLFILFIYFLYFCLCFISFTIKKNKKKRSIKNYLKENLLLFVLCFFLLIPFMLNLTLKYKVDWILNYIHFIFPDYQLNLIIVGINIISIIFYFFLNSNLLLLSFSLYDPFRKVIYDLSFATFGTENIIFFIYLFFLIVPSTSKRKTNQVLIFLKIWLIFSSIFILGYRIMLENFPNAVDNTLYTFIEVYRNRFYEFSAGILLLIIGYVLEEILIYFKELTKFLKKKIPLYRKLLLGRVSEIAKININVRSSQFRKIFRFESIIAFIIIISVINYYPPPLDYVYLHDDYLIDVVLAMGDETYLESNETIITPDLDGKPISRLLYRYNLIQINFSQTYDEILNISVIYNVSYIIIPLNDISTNDLEDFLLNFDIFYHNRYYFVISLN